MLVVATVIKVGLGARLDKLNINPSKFHDKSFALRPVLLWIP